MDLHTSEEEYKYFIVFAAEPGIPGHAMVAWRTEDSNGRIIDQKVFGFYPDLLGRSSLRDLYYTIIVTKPGNVFPDDSFFGATTERLEIRVDSQAYKCAEQVREQWDKVRHYHLFSNNCISFIQAVGESIGLRMPITAQLSPAIYVSHMRELAWPPRHPETLRGLPIITMPFPSPEWVDPGQSLFTLPVDSQTRAELFDLYGARDIIVAGSPITDKTPDRISEIVTRLYLNMYLNEQTNPSMLSSIPLKGALQNLRLSEEGTTRDAERRNELQREQQAKRAAEESLKAERKRREEELKRIYDEIRKREECARQLQEQREEERKKREEQERRIYEEAEKARRDAERKLREARSGSGFIPLRLDRDFPRVGTKIPTAGVTDGDGPTHFFPVKVGD